MDLLLLHIGPDSLNSYCILTAFKVPAFNYDHQLSNVIIRFSRMAKYWLTFTFKTVNFTSRLAKVLDLKSDPQQNPTRFSPTALRFCQNWFWVF